MKRKGKRKQNKGKRNSKKTTEVKKEEGKQKEQGKEANGFRKDLILMYEFYVYLLRIKVSFFLLFIFEDLEGVE